MAQQVATRRGNWLSPGQVATDWMPAALQGSLPATGNREGIGLCSAGRHQCVPQVAKCRHDGGSAVAAPLHRALCR